MAAFHSFLVVLVCSVFFAVTAQAVTVGIGSGGPGTFFDLATIGCSGGCGNTLVGNFPAGATASSTDCTVTINVDGDFNGLGSEDVQFIIEGFDLGVWTDGNAANDIFAADPAQPQCAVGISSTGTIPLAAWNAIIADGSIDVSVVVDPGVGFCGQELALLDMTFTEVVGGGGDPHLVGPHLPKMELHELLSVIEPARDVGDVDVQLLASSEAVLEGHVRPQPGSERFYFTEFTLASPQDVEDTLAIAFDVVDGHAYATIQDATSTHSCSQGGVYEASLSDAAFLRLDCSNAAERAQANGLMRDHFASHIPYAMASVSLETRHYSAEMFFVQKDGSAPTFGFYDFSFTIHTDEELAGVFTNTLAGQDEAARSTLSSEELTAASFHALSKNLRSNVAFA